jgi:hypothetical protein
MLARVQSVAAVLWGGLAGGAAAGFLARDALGLRQPLIALAWLLGAAIPLVTLGRGGMRGERGQAGSGRGPASGKRGQAGSGRGPARGERGQASVEFAALVLLAALALGALAAFGPRIDGRSFGGFLAFHIGCAVRSDCQGRDRSLESAYGPGDAALVRDLAPNLVYEPGERQLPVDWRDCRRPACAEAPDERGLDVHRTSAGEPATAFTRLIRRGGRTYVQYWLFYPDSKSVWASSDWIWERAWEGARRHGLVTDVPEYPGAHDDDWEAYAVRIDPRGRVHARASSHGHWTGCKEASCRDRWMARSGWTRVSRGSHAGHLPFRHELVPGPSGAPPSLVVAPGVPGSPRVRHVPLLPGHDLDERTTTSEGLRLIPLETLDASGYRPRDEGVRPPWQKDAYWDPESDGS